MGDKNILAYFKSPEEAENVARRLQSLRLQDVSINRFSRYPSESYDLMNSVSTSLSGLASITQQTSIGFPGADILSSADPSNSGMSDGGQGGPTGHDILLTAVMDEEVHHQVLRIIEEAGGIL